MKDCMLLFLHAVISRGKGDYYRLGNDATGPQYVPTAVEGLNNKIVIQIAVGALHCLALTESGEVRLASH